MGGSQPQPASGQLQSETATTPAKPDCPGQGPAWRQAVPPRFQPKGLQPSEAGRPGAGEGAWAPGRTQTAVRRERSALSQPGRRGSLGRGPSAPENPSGPREAGNSQPCDPRQAQAQASRPRSSIFDGSLSPSEAQKREPSHAQGDLRCRKEAGARPPPDKTSTHRAPRKGGALHSAEPPNPRRAAQLSPRATSATAVRSETNQFQDPFEKGLF